MTVVHQQEQDDRKSRARERKQKERARSVMTMMTMMSMMMVMTAQRHACLVDDKNDDDTFSVHRADMFAGMIHHAKFPVLYSF